MIISLPVLRWLLLRAFNNFKMKIFKKLIPELVLCLVILFLLVVSCYAWYNSLYTERLILIIVIGYITPAFVWWLIHTIKEYKKLSNIKCDGFVGGIPTKTNTYQYTKKRKSFFDKHKGRKYENL